MVSASADALSLMNTINNADRQPLDARAHRYGWWHANTIDDIVDDERLFSYDAGDMVLGEVCKKAADAYKCVHDKILEEYDKESCVTASHTKR